MSYEPPNGLTDAFAASSIPNRPATDSYSPRDRALAVLLALLAVHATYVLFAGLTQPISDFHGFRQSQTAISAYWLWRGGPWLAYETPVLGAPWAVPMELPVYQGLIALLRMIGVPIVVGGRITSFLFFAGLLWPLSVLFRSLNLGRTTYLTVSVLLFASPLYIFWSRTVMMESCALFFSLAWLAALSRLLARPGAWILIVTISAGCLGINAKSTTFAPFGLLGAAMVCWHFAPTWRQGPKWSHLLVLVACGIPFLSGVAWVAWSDQIKLANPLAAALTSSALTSWNFGSLALRTSELFWLDIIGRRVLPHTLGFMSGIALLIMCASHSNRRLRWPALLAFLAFLAPLLTFTNLHSRHHYYHYANAAFLLAAVGFGVVSIVEKGRPRLAFLGLAVLVSGQLLFYWNGFAPFVKADQSADRSIRIAAVVSQLTQPDQALLVFDSDWSSEIAFYSERRALMVPYWASEDAIRLIVRDPRAALGGTKLGVVVYCPDMLKNYPRDNRRILDFVAELKVLSDVAGCSILAPKSQEIGQLAPHSDPPGRLGVE
jgi:hypothetical protein